MLEEIRKNYILCAKSINDWQNANKNDLLNAYIDNENNNYLKNAYFSAIILRYWGNIGKYYSASKSSGFSIEDCYEWLIEALLYALEKRKWRDPTNKLYNDKCGPDKVVNRCIYSVRQLHYYLANRDKRSLNYGQVSLDDLVEQVGDHVSFLDSSNNNYEDNISDDLDFYLVLKKYFDNNKNLEGLILYTIYNNTPFTQTKNKYTFKLSSLVTMLTDYNEITLKNISEKYDISENTLSPIIEDLKSLDKEKIKKIAKSVLSSLAKDSIIKEYLCC
jgi:hypothetical protein